MRGFMVLALLLTGCARTPELPVLSQLPEFALTDEAGRSFARKDLQGHVWIADFIFTNCPGACIRMSRQMQEIQRQEPRVRLASFTVDPARDDSAVLAAYARRNHADPARWRFLTGTAEELAKVSSGALIGKQGLDHSTRLFLIDQQGRLRGTYESHEPDAVARVLKDAASLL